LASLELGEPGYFSAAATDVPNFFYSLRMPAGFEAYAVLEGVDFTYVRQLLEAEGFPCGDWPADADAFGCRCLPMGFSWAPLLAQTVLEHVVAEAGLAGECELVHHREQSLALKRWATLCYLDDFTVLVKRASQAAARHAAGGLMARVKRVLDEVGLGSHKDQAGESIEVLGVLIDASAGQVTLRPLPGRFSEVLAATREVLRRRSIEVHTLQRLVGHWAWWLQLCRPLYSVLQEVYPILIDSGGYGRIQLPAAVRRELRLLLHLAPCLRCKLSWPLSPKVHMVDAGPEFGAVVTTTLWPAPTFSEEVAPPPRRKWALALQRRWGRQEHNTLTEGRTVLWAVRRCARAGVREKRCVIYTDSLVVLGAFTKGRSSSRALNRLCRCYAALCLAFRIRPILKYVPSAENLADGPSRGIRYPCVAPETKAKGLAASGRPPGLAEPGGAGPAPGP